jgi:hypothetical protein
MLDCRRRRKGEGEGWREGRPRCTEGRRWKDILGLKLVGRSN